MHFNSKLQEETHKKAILKKYKAVAFDVDGTLTKFAGFVIPESLKKALVQIPVPKAFCTGRPIENMGAHLEKICNMSKNPKKELESWTIISENGSAISEYQKKTQDYKMIYEVLWPEERITRETLSAFIKDKFGWHAIVALRGHCLVTHYHAWMYLFPRGIRLLSHHTALSLRKMLKKMDLDDILSIQDSGIGNLIVPTKSGKGKAIKVWANHLGIDVKDVLVIGDQPGIGENDEEFLSGDFGTAFSVGSLTKNVYPLPAFDAHGHRLTGPKGTEWMVRNVGW
ncbi:MAG: HAD hydrolase family protein [Candidatus Gracilibacteria bacterium]